MIDSRAAGAASRARGHSSGGGTSGRSTHCPSTSRSRRAERGVDGEDLGVADVADGPGLGDAAPVGGQRDVDVEDRRAAGRRTGTAPSPTRPGARWCASRAAMAAPSAAPAEQEGAAGRDAGVTGSTQRIGLWVGSRPSQVRASIAADSRSRDGAGGPCSRIGRSMFSSARLLDHDRHPVAGGRLLARRRLPLGRALADRGARGGAGRHRGAASSTPSRSSTPTGARAAAAAADVSLPFGGVPLGVKELEPVEGWPATEASLVFDDRVGRPHRHDDPRALEAAGVVPVGQTTASEFGGLNVSVTKLHGVTHNPWQHGRTAGGSSGGSRRRGGRRAGADRHGRRRRRVDPHPRRVQRARRHEGHRRAHPAGPPHRDRARSPWCIGCLARSVRDVARWYDVCSGYDSRDPYSLPRSRRLGARPRHPRPARARRAVIAPDARQRRRPPRGRGDWCGRPARRWPRDAGLRAGRRAGATCPASASSGRWPTWRSCGASSATGGRTARTT